MPDKGITPHQALVLWHITMPGVLVELGFLNNAHDREVLVTESGKRKMAAAMLAAVGEYFAIAPSAATKPAVATPAVPAEKPATKPAAKPAKRVDNAGTFAIQILSTTRKVPKGSSELKGYKPVEKYKGGRYRYYVGPYDTRAAAQEKLPEVRRSFRDAFVTTIE